MGSDTEQKRTIRDTNALIRALVEQEMLDYPFWVSGSVSRCFISQLGHIYFDLTEDDYTISCMVREQTRGKLDVKITNGIELEVFGSIRVFDRKAQIQIEVEKAKLIENPPFVMDATVQEQLAEKGLWPRTKRPLPVTINQIGIITSKHSDALHDFEDIYRAEHGTARTRLIDVRIQGQQAAHDISRAIERLNQEKSADVIAIIRGGGRSDDLAVYDDILIAEAICRSEIPVVTGIGHQRDHSLADEVADAALNTPTAAGSHLARHTQPKSEPPKSAAWGREYIVGLAIVFGALVIAIALLSRPV